MQSWAAEELKYVQLGDERLNKRLVKMVETFAGNPECSVPKACKTWAATRASYIFWDNQKVKPDDIILAHKKSTLERIQSQKIQGNDTILAIQDTTNLDFTKHPKTKGLGHLDHLAVSGLKVHSCLTVSLDGEYIKRYGHETKRLKAKNISDVSLRRKTKKVSDGLIH